MIRLLFVDDDAAIRRVFQRLFPAPAYEVHVAETGVEALDLIEANDYDAIISDFRMPRMDGGELLARACDRRPDSTRILVTAESDFDVAVRAVNRGEVFRMVRKPWDDDALHFAVKLGVEMRYMRRERQEMLRRLEEKTTSLTRINQDLGGLNRQLERRVQERSRVIVDSLVSALAFRQPDAPARARRIAAVGRRIGEQLGLGARELDDVEVGALLHDVGRLAIRDELFFKRGGLSEAETAELQRHPSAGDKLLRPLAFLDGARRIVMSHRERFDGTGHPLGLAGQEIPIGARIFAVAETAELALSDPTVPTGGSAVSAALDDLEAGRGRAFDPEVVAAFAAVSSWDWTALRECEGGELLLEVA